MNDHDKSKQELIRELEALRRENRQLKQALAGQGAGPGRGYGKTIMVVDDNDGARELVADMMEELGHEPVEAATAGDAVAMV